MEEMAWKPVVLAEQEEAAGFDARFRRPANCPGAQFEDAQRAR